MARSGVLYLLDCRRLEDSLANHCVIQTQPLEVSSSVCGNWSSCCIWVTGRSLPYRLAVRDRPNGGARHLDAGQSGINKGAHAISPAHAPTHLIVLLWGQIVPRASRPPPSITLTTSGQPFRREALP